MIFFTKIDGPASGPKHLKAVNGWMLEERDYPEDIAEAFLAEAARWCVETFHHYHTEDFCYNVEESWEKTTYVPIMPREIVIADGAVAAFIRHTGRYAPYNAGLVQDVSLLMIDPQQRKKLVNIVDHHSSENYDNDIYYVYSLLERSQLPEGAVVEPTRIEQRNVIF